MENLLLTFIVSGFGAGMLMGTFVRVISPNK